MHIRLGQILLSQGSVGEADVERALAYQRNHVGDRLGAILVRLGALSEDVLYSALAEQSGRPLIDGAGPPEQDVRQGLSAWPMTVAWWQRQAALPWMEGDVRHVAAQDPLLPELREAVEADGQSVIWHYLHPATLERWLRLHQREESAASTTLDARALREMAEDAPVITFVNNVLAQAVDARASDVHFEPGEREFSVLLRIDGVLHARQSQPMERYPAIASRVKLVAQLDIAERRLPQDGRTSIRVSGADLDVRVSSIPSVHGESLVLRLLPKERRDLQLDRLGLPDDQLPVFRQWLSWPNGLVLVTGPTGSGKSTTLYAALAAINDRSRKIVTVEDPVEFRLPHVVQIQTQVEIGLSFARALRSILRHDPDIIMIGEIRDRETAEIAIQSALTGHLVLATLHTNDALSAITRLVDMGIEPYLVAAALRATMAQRLVRRLCEDCAATAETEDALQHRWQSLVARSNGAAWTGTQAHWRRAIGCAACQRTGYRGRVGIYELVPVTAELQHLVASSEPSSVLEQRADAAGRRSMIDDGLIKSRQGLTTFDDVLRAAGGAFSD